VTLVLAAFVGALATATNGPLLAARAGYAATTDKSQRVTDAQIAVE